MPTNALPRLATTQPIVRQTANPARQRVSNIQTSALVPHNVATNQPPHFAYTVDASAFAADSNPPSRRFNPQYPLAASSKSRPSVRRSVVLLSAFLALSVFFLTHLNKSSVTPLHNDLLRYSHASAHFRKSLSPEQLDAYYKEREAALSLVSDKSQSAPSSSSSQQQQQQQHEQRHDIVVTANVTSSYFESCIISTERSVMHPALRRGPDAKEIEGRASAKQPRDFDDVFSVVDRKRYYFNADRTAVQTVDHLGAGLDTDLDDAIKVARAVSERDAKASVSDVNVPIAYMRTTRQDGWQTIINFGGVANTTVDGTAKRVNIRRMVTISKSFGKPCDVHFVRPREVVRINVVVPYSNRPHRIAAFLKMFALYFGASNSNMVRVVVSTSEAEEGDVISVGKSHAELNDDRFLVVTSKGDEFGNFSRAVAIREAVNMIPADEIMFISDTDLAIGGNFLQNCRVNIVRGSQVWFPVMFSLFPYGRGLSSKDGMWRRSSYGMACLYQSDFVSVGGFGPNEESAFTGWGSEDVFLYNRFRDNAKYAVLRTLEPGLQHQWHGKDCEHNEHYENCMRTVYMTIGSQDAIAKLMVDAKVDISDLTKDALPV